MLRCCFSHSSRDGENQRSGEVTLPRMTSPRSAANGLEPEAAPQVRGEELPRMEPQGGVRSPRAALAKGSPKERAVLTGLCARGPVSVPNLLSCPLPSRSPRIPRSRQCKAWWPAGGGGSGSRGLPQQTAGREDPRRRRARPGAEHQRILANKPADPSSPLVLSRTRPTNARSSSRRFYFWRDRGRVGLNAFQPLGRCVSGLWNPARRSIPSAGLMGGKAGPQALGSGPRSVV